MNKRQHLSQPDKVLVDYIDSTGKPQHYEYKTIKEAYKFERYLKQHKNYSAALTVVMPKRANEEKGEREKWKKKR